MQVARWACGTHLAQRRNGRLCSEGTDVGFPRAVHWRHQAPAMDRAKQSPLARRDRRPRQQLVAKFAWAEAAAERVWHEARILQVLGSYPALCTPRVVATSSDPALLVTEWVAGEPLTYEEVGRSDRPWLERTACELARFLADLHRPEVLAAVVGEVGPIATPVPQATTDAIRQRLSPWLRPDQIALVTGWCDWADGALAAVQVNVFVHGDLHGHNQVWNERQELRAVVDFEESGPAEAAFDFRYLPSQGPTVELFVATCERYAEFSGSPVDVARVMAWNVRTVLGDALWRSEAGVALPGGGTAAEWVDGLGTRLADLDLVSS